MIKENRYFIDYTPNLRCNNNYNLMIDGKRCNLIIYSCSSYAFWVYAKEYEEWLTLSKRWSEEQITLGNFKEINKKEFDKFTLVNKLLK